LQNANATDTALANQVSQTFVTIANMAQLDSFAKVAMFFGTAILPTEQIVQVNEQRFTKC